MQRVGGQIWSVLTAHAGGKANLSKALADQLPLSKLGVELDLQPAQPISKDHDLCAVT